MLSGEKELLSWKKEIRPSKKNLGPIAKTVPNLRHKILFVGADLLDLQVKNQEVSLATLAT